jgi:diguanylate cyclase (GGDEF)-like protein
MRHSLDGFHTLFLELDRKVVLVIVIGLIVLLGWLDYVTGFEITFSFFYLIPIALATWYIDIRVGYVVTVVCIVVWILSNRLAGATYSQESIRYWNASVRLAVFFAISSLLDRFKRVLEAEQLLSRTDHLTGIMNNREFYNQAELEVKRASRYKHPLTLAYIDLDNFKQVNDRDGHQAGDRLLRSVTQTISQEIRKTDVFARLGGDEFALLLPNTDQASARHVLNKIGKTVLAPLRAAASPVTLSIGVVTFLSAPPTMDELIHQADTLMYQAKTVGKNRTLYLQVE